ncbi:MAG TPA: hypothetical protein VM115_10715 [Vicinamibacterales bacterium]|nr:hypothetical protein [Vicinamibacterales bacterium]
MAIANPRKQFVNLPGNIVSKRSPHGPSSMPSQDHGFMYGNSFYDVDGHHWEVMWMDPDGLH